MNILIPMAGLGTRFAKTHPGVAKPMIPVNGVPMIKRAVDSLGVKGRLIFVIRKDSGIDIDLLESLGDCKVITIPYMTEGPACTCLEARREIEDEPLIITNCDQIMHWNGQQFKEIIESTNLDGLIVTYYKNDPRNSYAALDANGLVKRISEKIVISDISLNGIHFWKNGSDFVKSANHMIATNRRAINGEFYVSESYNHMIENGKKIGIYHIPGSMHHAVGTPEDLASYEEKFDDRLISQRSSSQDRRVHFRTLLPRIYSIIAGRSSQSRNRPKRR